MIVAGFGFRRAATLDSLADALAATGGAPDALATAADKASALAPLGARLGLPVHAVPPDALSASATQTDSTASKTHRGTGSVAEAAALAAAGRGARLLTPRVISADRMATCALAASSGEIP
ncbi:cobalamin biosynthesis protein [Palleronia sp.]|uniref:cobalamin biosynthesis protein n=1 Tax=Palleronia sp. TaxID=1940284 RepID=UPI0035C78CE3